jgi:manganese transport protein
MKKLLEEYKVILSEKESSYSTGLCKPNKSDTEIINEGNFDVLVMGTHGHTGSKIYFWNYR